MFNIIIKDTYEEVSLEAFKALKKVISDKEKPVLGLATGSSPIGLYKNMQEDYKKGYSYKNCITFNLDEYIGLDKEHDQTYWTFMHKNLFDNLDIPEENIHIPSAVGKDLQELCSDYDKALNEYVIDVQVLGIGGNGHIGFNEPGTSFDTKTNIVELQERTRLDNARFFNSLDEVPTKAITMGISSIMQAKNILVIATGLNKADAVYGMIKGEISVDCPASVLQNHPSVTVVLDKDAASKL